MSDQSLNSLYRGIITGSLAAMSTASITHPLDVLKVRLSIQGENQKKKIKFIDRYKLVKKIIQRERLSGLYAGMSATLLRQAVYSGSRFGIYDQINSKIMTQNRTNNHLPITKQFFISAISGAFSAFISCPIDVILVRMQARGRPYKNVLDGFFEIIKNEGVRPLYRGLYPLLFRGMSVTSAQFLTYERLKDELIKKSQLGDDTRTHFLSGMGAGLVATFVSTPIDVIKSRMMNSLVPYKSSFHCFTNTVSKEGPKSLFKGLLPCGMRMIPHVIILWQFMEQYKKLWENYINDEK